MIIWEEGLIVNILDETDDIQILLVKYNDKTSKAINYLEFNPVLKVGDLVFLNRTATSLGLGTGGYDFVVIPKSKLKSKPYIKQSGHIMKLRYTPYQFAVKSCEEQDSKYHDLFKSPKVLDGLPVIIGELHSMLPIIVTIYRVLEKQNNKKKKITYIMTDGGALPISLSNHVRTLIKLGWLDNTITIGNSFGGDLEAINIYTGLIAAKYILNADIVIVLMGPGITGTGTWLGYTGVEQGIIANAVNSLQGKPISIIRASTIDERKRHKGISHHSLTNLEYISLTSNIIPYPKYIERNYPIYFNELTELKSKHQIIPVEVNSKQINDILNKYPLLIKTMNRTIKDDPIFFDFVASSAILAYELMYE